MKNDSYNEIKNLKVKTTLNMKQKSIIEIRDSD